MRLTAGMVVLGCVGLVACGDASSELDALATTTPPVVTCYTPEQVAVLRIGASGDQVLMARIGATAGRVQELALGNGRAAIKAPDGTIGYTEIENISKAGEKGFNLVTKEDWGKHVAEVRARTHTEESSLHVPAALLGSIAGALVANFVLAGFISLVLLRSRWRLVPAVATALGVAVFLASFVSIATGFGGVVDVAIRIVTALVCFPLLLLFTRRAVLPPRQPQGS